MQHHNRLSVATIAAKVRRRKCSTLVIAEDILARVAAYDAIQPQTWISRIDPDVVRQQARRIDARIDAGEILPLAGVPYAVKDNIDVANLPTTAGCPAFAYEPRRSATVIEYLENAGALLIGKTNLDQFATGLVGTRSPFGACGCVYNRDYISGGSSSGSAVAVAAGLVAFALGTDTAGSGRVPAAFNNLVGLKPTKGRWSTRGLLPACRTLDCITAFTSTVSDAALVDAVLAKFDSEDAYSRVVPSLSAYPPAKTIGIPLPAQLNFFGDNESEALFGKALARAKSLGLTLTEVDISPLLAAAQLLYSGPWIAERTAAAETLLRSNPSAIDPVVRSILQAGTVVTGVETFRGQYDLKAYEQKTKALWQHVDALLLPTTPTIYRLREIQAEPVSLNNNLGLYTNFVNLLDMSAIALPAGFRANNTGFGVTLMGAAFSDSMLLELAARFEQDPVAPALDLRERPAELMQIAVVGAHLAGMPLHWQLSSRDARLVRKTHTAAAYKLYAMENHSPLRPALVHVGAAGAAIEVEIYEIASSTLGDFIAGVAPPLAIGTLLLADGSEVKGFVAEPRAMENARDITAFGGWRAYIDSEVRTH
jgi:allophanate hydrolase